MIFLQAKCKSDTKDPVVKDKGLDKQVAQLVNVPSFSADSAFAYIEKQVSFGPRIPGTKGWSDCADWLRKKLASYGVKVKVQEAEVTLWDGTPTPMKNIIASFNPEIQRRIFLCAHWDTRPWADNEDDATKHDDPILGANDGGSGVAVLIELTRILSEWGMDFGLDIILFDVEDSGKPDVRDSYCLGSQYWAAKPHVPSYQASYGILLDMVGAADATFKKEAYSTRYLPAAVNQLWSVAAILGHGNYFSNEEIGPIIDDHVYINLGSSNVCMDVIHHDGNNFGSSWHTHDDDMDIIDTKTLQAVGESVLHNILLDLSKKARQAPQTSQLNP